MALMNPVGSYDSHDISTLIRAIGEPAFGVELLGFLNKVCGAEHCAIFDWHGEAPRQRVAISHDGSSQAYRRTSQYLSTGLWQDDLAFKCTRDQVSSRTPSIQRIDIRDLPHNDLRHIIYELSHVRQRLLLCGDGNRNGPVLSILRGERRGCVSESETAALESVSVTLLSILGKQNEIAWQRDRLSSALSSLETIEACIQKAPEGLPRRETEVCARIVYGISTIGIALDLDIGEQTVTTYRKRAYQRLGIGSQRELLTWYMERWALHSTIH
ncbi:helix-turn-helix transcriptional regulator [Sphingobium sp. HWE2-09]|uniref:helix-turn-helix transcriptional regulator n=1 Tax=Sphingobium sp. HWE2-09 TaxID=3108390 RepID=UPI002DCE71B5|nr:helix-turn-helix transcriptional regulator [Sphingobium sp. HWE2-09]